jgi:hypothetical protein
MRKPGMAYVISLTGSLSVTDPASYVREADRALTAGDVDLARALIAQAYRAFDAYNSDARGRSGTPVTS